MVDAPQQASPAERKHAGGSGTIRRRVSRILALPAIVVLVLLAVVAAAQVADYRDSSASSRSVALTLAVEDLVKELQTERGVTAAVLGGNDSFTNLLGPARQRVDAQRASVEELVTDGESADTAEGTEIRNAVRLLRTSLTGVRASADAGSTADANVDAERRTDAFDYFTARIAALSNVDLGLDLADDEQLRQGASTLQSLQDLSEALSQERAYLNGVFSAGRFGEGEFVRFAAMRAAKEEALARFARTATAQEQASLDFVLDTGAARIVAHFEDVAAAASTQPRVVVNPQTWWSGLTTVLDDLTQLQEHVGSGMQLRAHEVQQGVTLRIGLLLGAVVLCFAGSVYLAVVASRSITQPLAQLAAEADNVASERLSAAVRRAQTGDESSPPVPPLPVQVPARSTREVHQVATALDRLQHAAYSLATEQATQRRRTIESLTNLGHRNQNLIRRQLGFITSLEREEINPEQLSNLFELDHLATRMRRNAASLLVLVGASSPRQWATPVPVADVIRAAVSEVEEYRRVTLRRVDDALVNGTAIGAAAHLLSELIENGLTFSPPDAAVEVQGRWVDDSYLIAITDQGIGMSEEDMALANARLRGEGDFLAAPTRFLGHFVVGQLARESSIHVELRPSPLTGVTARVTLPAALMVRPTVLEAPPQTVLADSAQLTPGLRALPQYGQHGQYGEHGDPLYTGPQPIQPIQPSQPVQPQPVQQPVEPAHAHLAQPVEPHRPRWPEPMPAPNLPPSPAAPPSVPTGGPTLPRRYVPDHPTPPAGINPRTGSTPVQGPRTGSTPAQPRTGSTPVQSPRTGSTPAQPPRTGSVPVHGVHSSNGPRSGSTPVQQPPPGYTAAPAPGGVFGLPAHGTGGIELGADGERTRNGLRKRVRQSPATGAVPADRGALGGSAARNRAARTTTAVDDSPSQVGARLTAFRAGMERARKDPATGGTPAQPDRPDRPEHGEEDTR